jgi:hypothetical protein
MASGSPPTDGVREADFDSVNGLLEQVEANVKAEFAVGPLGVLDRLGGPLDDAMWNLRAARSTAWTNARCCGDSVHLPLLRDRFFVRLDSLVGMSGRGLLVRLDQIKKPSQDVTRRTTVNASHRNAVKWWTPSW